MVLRRTYLKNIAYNFIYDMEVSMSKRPKKINLPISPSTLLIIGYIFAFFATISPEKRTFGIILFVATVVGHIFYLLGAEQKAVRAFVSAKKYLDKGKTEKGVKLLLNAVRLTDNFDDLRYLLKGRCKNPKSYGNAANILAKECINDNDTSFFRYLVASMFYYAGNVKKAVELLKDIPVENSNVKIARLLGASLMDLKRFEDAIKALKEFEPPLLPMREDDLAVLFGIGVSYIKIGDKENGKKYLERVAMRNPRFGGVTKILGQLEKETSE